MKDVIFLSQSYYLYDNKEEMVFNNNNKWISLDKISPYLIDATISTEDKHFYHHPLFSHSTDYLKIPFQSEDLYHHQLLSA